ncbi:MAG: transglycosylase SLT domain-containing protein [Caulobacterales bacterium]
MDVEALARATGAASSIARAADATGVDFSYLMNAAMRESSFKANARNPKSSASGMFQFIEQTWLAMVKKHGEKHGLSELAAQVKTDGTGRLYVSNPQQRREILGLRFDPETSAKLAGEYTAENAEYLINKLGRPPTNAELYAAHVLGPKAAARLAHTAEDHPEARAASMFPIAARGNRSLFYADNGRPLNAREALNGFGEMNDALGQVAPGYQVAKAPALKGRLQEDDDGTARAAFMDALVALQVQPIGFAKGGFGEAENDSAAASAQMLIRAFNHQL